MGEVTVTWNDSALNQMLRGQDGDVAKYLLGVARDAETEAKRLATNDMVNVRTGRLRGSHGSTIGNDGSEVAAFLTNNVEYAVEVHETRPWLTTAVDNIVGRL